MAASTGYVLNISAIDNATKVIGRVNKSLAGIQAPAKRLNAQLAKFAEVSGFNRLREGFSSLGDHVKNATGHLAKLLPALGAIFGAASLAGIAALTTKWANFVTGLEVTAARLGTSTQRVQEFQMVAGQFGVSAETMNGALQTLGSTMQDAIMGRNAQAADYFRMLGINIQDSTFKAKTGAEQFELVRQALQNIQDPEQRARIGAMLLGDSYSHLGRYATASAAEVEAARREIQKYVLTTSQTQGADRFARAQYLLSQSVEHFVNVLSSKLEPILTPIIEKVRQFIDTWATEEGMDKLVGYVKEGITWLTDMWKTIDNLVQKFGGWQKAITLIVEVGLGAWALAAVAPILSLALAIGGLTVAMLSNPVGAVIAGLALLGVAVYECWEHWDWIKEQLTAFWNYLQDITGGKVTLILAILVPFIGIPALIYEHWDEVKAWAVAFWAFIQSKFDDAVKTIKASIDVLLTFPDMIKSGWNSVTTFFESMWNKISGLFDEGWKKVEKILDKVKGALQWIRDLNPFGSDTPKEVESNTLGSGGSGTGGTGGTSVLGGGGAGRAPLPYGPLDTSGGTPIQGGDKFERGRAIHDLLVQNHGWDDQKAWGAAANAIHESGGNHQVRPGDSGLAHGLFQWHPDRYAHFQEQYGHMPEQGTLAENVAFLDWETRNTEKRNARRLNSAGSAAEAGAAISRDIIRPGVDEAARSREERDRAATAAWLSAEAARRAAGKPPMPTAAPSPVAAPAPAETPVPRGGQLPTLAPLPSLLPPGGASRVPSPLDGLNLGRIPVSGAQPANGQVQVNVNIAGAPTGTTASATATGAGVTAQPPRVSAMPAGGLS